MQLFICSGGNSVYRTCTFHQKTDIYIVAMQDGAPAAVRSGVHKYTVHSMKPFNLYIFSYFFLLLNELSTKIKKFVYYEFSNETYLLTKCNNNLHWFIVIRMDISLSISTACSSI